MKRFFIGIILGLGVLTAGSASFSKFQDLFLGHNEWVYRVLTDESMGTGFATLTPTGRAVVITNNHVCGNGPVVHLDTDINHSKIPVKILKRSKLHDICILEAPPGAKPHILYQSAPEGTPIFVVGHGLGRPLMVTYGEIKQMDLMDVFTDEVDVCNGEPPCYKKYFVQLNTATILPGNSGSPVVDFEGRVVGLIFAGSNYLTAAVPIEFVKFELMDL